MVVTETGTRTSRRPRPHPRCRPGGDGRGATGEPRRCGRYLLIAPTGLGLAVFYLWPVLQTAYFSFTEWGPFGGHEWIGLDNYRTLAADDEVLRALANTWLYTVLGLLGIPVAIVFAALLNRPRLRGRRRVPDAVLPAGGDDAGRRRDGVAVALQRRLRADQLRAVARRGRRSALDRRPGHRAVRAGRRRRLDQPRLQPRHLPGRHAGDPAGVLRGRGDRRRRGRSRSSAGSRCRCCRRRCSSCRCCR